MPDPIAELTALIGEGGDSFLGLFYVSIQLGYRIEPVVLEEPVVGMKLCHILQLVPQLSRQDHFPGVVACQLDQGKEDSQNGVGQDHGRVVGVVGLIDQVVHDLLHR